MWDTTTITDGIFRLKISVYRENGSVSEIIVEDIRVGNYTHYDGPATTANAAVVDEPFSEGETPLTDVTIESTAVMKPLPTDLPKNPAAIGEGDFKLSFISGLTLVVLVLFVLGVYVLFRRVARK
ncbi:MAG: hypothetical protein Q8R87_03795 [Anaerolineaceae bacterium]|nr:hypothetical protein [Anaerolineaceae bacterium]